MPPTADPLTDLQRLVRLSPRHHRHQLIAPITTGDITGADLGANELATDEDLVTHTVPVPVVDLLEVIDIEDQQSNGTLLAVGPRELAYERVVEIRG